MMLLTLTAIAMGCLGSLHCVGMCGPIALSVPVPATTNFAKFIAALLYNLGRVVTYAAMGAVIGLVGASFALFGFQQWLSILAGTAILIYLIWPRLNLYKKGHHRFQFILEKLRTSLSKLFKQRKYRSAFFIGLLNGLLPCGLVYMAIATAVATGSVAESSWFMAAFGLGTLPLMWAVTFFGNVISIKSRIAIRKAYPYIFFIMACLLIVRGMGLGIPYLSPQWHSTNELSKISIECHVIK